MLSECSLHIPQTHSCRKSLRIIFSAKYRSHKIEIRQNKFLLNNIFLFIAIMCPTILCFTSFSATQHNLRYERAPPSFYHSTYPHSHSILIFNLVSRFLRYKCRFLVQNILAALLKTAREVTTEDQLKPLASAGHRTQCYFVFL